MGPIFLIENTIWFVYINLPTMAHYGHLFMENTMFKTIWSWFFPMILKTFLQILETTKLLKRIYMIITRVFIMFHLFHVILTVMINCLQHRETSGGRGRTLADRWLEDPPEADQRWKMVKEWWKNGERMVKEWWKNGEHGILNLWKILENIWPKKGAPSVKITELMPKSHPKALLKFHLFQLF